MKEQVHEVNQIEDSTPPPDESSAEQPDVAVEPAEERPVLTKRQRVLAIAQKLVILAGAAAALWLTWQAYAPKSCGCCSRSAEEKAALARDLKLETGGRQNP